MIDLGPRQIGSGCLTGAVVLFALIGVFGSFYTIDEGERGVVLTNGKVSDVSLPGFHLKVPIFQDVVTLSIRTERADYVTSSYSKDIQAADLKLNVNHRLDASRVAEVYGGYGIDYADRILAPRVLSAAKVVFGQYNAATAVAERARLNAEMHDAIAESVQAAGIIVESIQIEDIDFSEAFERSIEQRMEAEVEVLRLKQNWEREKVQADIVRTQAEADADRIRAEAMAQADATRARGEAEAASIDARGKALRDNPGLIALIQAERWDGRLPTTMPPDGTVPFLNLAPAVVAGDRR